MFVAYVPGEGTKRDNPPFSCMHFTYANRSNIAVLLDEAIQIAWDYPERTGEIEDAEVCSWVLMYHVESMIRQGVRSRLLLSNRAIRMYSESKLTRDLKVAS